MTKKSKQLSNSFSTGGGGSHFEAHVQASFVALMLTGGYAPCLPCWPIVEIKLQGKVDGFDVDDLIVSVENQGTGERRKLLGQVKHSICITKGDSDFSEVMQAAWNDFNNPSVFTKDKDIIALITGPLNRTDSDNVQWLLKQAKETQDADTFYRRVERAKFSPNKSGEKLRAIKHQLKLANDNTDVPPDELYSFLGHFYLLGYDLGEEKGVVLSLLQSHISQFNMQYPERVWSRVVDIVQIRNHGAGTITRENLPEDLMEAFKQPEIIHIPEELEAAQVAGELTAVQPETEEIDWNKHQYASYLALANLVGAWNGNNDSDTAVLGELTGEEYSDWIQKAADILNLPDSPFLLRNGRWEITERADLWNSLGSRISDRDLDAFKNAVLTVLTERDPSFDLPQEERYAAGIYGKVLKHSPELRKGLAEGLAILGNKSEVFSSCSPHKAKHVAISIIHEIFSNADWILWGSLNDMLPILSEAAPDKFLDVVEKALTSSPCPFDELFAQEGSGLTGRNYLTGLFWALEGLAWDEESLVRVCGILGDIASHDPGGNWANRPFNSLVTILLPWFPQTLAPVGKRKVAVETLLKDRPQIGWELVVSLLPGQNKTSSGSHKPLWRDITIPEDERQGTTHEEYWEQVSFYAKLAVSEAGHDTERLAELVNHLNILPKPSYDELLGILSSDVILDLPEDQKLHLWDCLINLIHRHRQHSDASWALDNESLLTIEAVAEKLSPSDPFNFYQHLFSGLDANLYEETGNWEEQEKKLEKRRQQAIGEILESGGIKSVISFAESVELPNQVGHSLGIIADEETDSILLPEYLISEDHKLSSFIHDYVWSRRYAKGWSWVDEIDKSAWTPAQIGQFLGFLPFTNETWTRANKWLGKRQGEYWSRTKLNPRTDSKLNIAVEKLIRYKRPKAAISCLGRMFHDNREVDPSLCVRALVSTLSSTEQSYFAEEHYIVDLIKFLQESSEVSPSDLSKIEWGYLPLLGRSRDASPKLLGNLLANDPEFFCDVIQLLYRSEKTDADTDKPSKQLEALADNAWQLLHEWRLPPGTTDDGNFDGDKLKIWLRRVKEISTESGHLEVALIHAGKVLIHCPEDADGLWINRTAAEVLNSPDAEIMRESYETAWFNSRGPYYTDPTGKQERELANKFQQKADDVENAGFRRLAVNLRRLAKRYDQDAGKRL